MELKEIINLTKENQKELIIKILNGEANFGDFKVKYSIPEVNASTPFGNVYVISMQHKYEGLELGLYTHFNNEETPYNLLVLGSKLHEVLDEFKSYAHHYVTFFEEKTKEIILDNYNYVRNVKPGDSQRVYKMLPVVSSPVAIADGFTSMSASDIKTAFDFPKREDNYELYQYIVSIIKHNDFTHKKDYNYLTDNQVISYVLEVKIEDYLRNFNHRQQSLEQMIRQDKFPMKIFHYSE